MKKESRSHPLLSLFLTFFKLGLFSFGGGTTMLMLLKEELVNKKKWLNDEELTEMTGIAESTPGPIAINLATYLGYKRQGFLGALCATLGVVFPTFFIMFIISLFFKNLLQFKAVQYLFMGVKCAVIFLILKVSFSLMKGLKRDYFAIILFIIVVVLMTLFNIFKINFSAIYFILIGALLGILFYSLLKAKLIRKGEKK